jgi:hypothetical protein
MQIHDAETHNEVLAEEEFTGDDREEEKEQDAFDYDVSNSPDEHVY